MFAGKLMYLEITVSKIRQTHKDKWCIYPLILFMCSVCVYVACVVAHTYIPWLAPSLCTVCIRQSSHQKPEVPNSVSITR